MADESSRLLGFKSTIKVELEKGKLTSAVRSLSGTMKANSRSLKRYNHCSFPPVEPEGDRIPRTERTLARPNRTLFDAESASDENLRMFRRLKKHQLDVAQMRADVDTKKKMQEEYKYNMITTLGQQLELPERMIARSRTWFMNLDLQKLGHKTELVAFCVLLYIMLEDEKREDSPWNRAYHPNRGDEKNDERTRQLIEELPPEFKVTNRTIRKLFGKLDQSPKTRNQVENVWSEFGTEDPLFIPFPQ